MSETTFDLAERFEKIFKIFNVKNIDEFCLKLNSLKKKANLEDDLSKLNINIKDNLEKIISGINLLRLGNNPIKINKNDIVKIISK